MNVLLELEGEESEGGSEAERRGSFDQREDRAEL
jgi:hypothetical protein